MVRVAGPVFGGLLAVSGGCGLFSDEICDGSASTVPIEGPAIGAGGNNSDNPFRALAIRPDDPDTVYVGSEGNGLFVSKDGGSSWRRLRAGLIHCGEAYAETYSIAIDPDRPARMLIATDAGPGPIGSGTTGTAGIYRSEDAGETWAQVNAGLPTADANSVLILPGGGVVIGLGAGASTNSGDGGFFPGGLFVGDVSSASWTAATAPAAAADSLFWQIVARDAGLLVFGGDPTSGEAEGVGLLRSTDRGATWTALPDPLGGRPGAHLDASPDLETIYADVRAEWPSPRFLRSTDGGTSWTPPSEQISAAGGPIRILGADPQVVLLGMGDRLIRTEDGFDTVTEVAVAPSNANEFMALEIAPSDPLVIYATTKGLLVYRSVDGGLTFELRADLRVAVL